MIKGIQGHPRASKDIQGHPRASWASMVNLSNIATVHRNRDLYGDLRIRVVKEVTSNNLTWLELMEFQKGVNIEEW